MNRSTVHRFASLLPGLLASRAWRTNEPAAPAPLAPGAPALERSRIAIGAPVAVDVKCDTRAGTPLAVQLGGRVAPGGNLTYHIVQGPDYGTLDDLDPVTGSVTYTPRRGHRGADSFSYVVNDGRRLSAPAVVAIAIAAASDAPATDDLGFGSDAGASPALAAAGSGVDDEDRSHRGSDRTDPTPPRFS